MQAADGAADADGLCGHFRKVVGRDAELAHGGGQAHFLIVGFEAADGFEDGGFRFSRRDGDAHDAFGELEEDGDVVFVDVAHPCRGDDGEARAVRDVVAGAEFVFHGVAGPVLFAAEAEEVVVGDGAGEGEFGPGVVLPEAAVAEEAGVVDDGAEGGFAEGVGEVGVRGVGEVAFEDVAHHVARAVGELVFGEGVEEFGVDDAEDGAEFFAAVAEFAFGGGAGDDAVGAAIAASRRDGEDGGDAEGGEGSGLFGDEVFPDVAMAGRAEGDGFGGVDDAAATDGEDDGDGGPASEGDAFPDEVEGGVGLDSAESVHFNARFLQGADDIFVKAGTFDAAASVVQEDFIGIGFDVLADGVLGAFAEDDVRVVAVGEIEHGDFVFFSGRIAPDCPFSKSGVWHGRGSFIHG